MWVEGVGGIYLDQFANYRYDTDRPNQAFFGSGEHYNYITYTSKNGVKREALFLFANSKAQKDFSRALMRWVDQDGRPIPNYKLPNSQGPQDTQGRYKGLNVVDSDSSLISIRKSIAKVMSTEFKENLKTCDSPYGDGNSTKKLIELLIQHETSQKLIVKDLTC